MNQELLIYILLILLILLLMCKIYNKNILELFGISGLDNQTKQNNTLINSSSDNEILFFYADWCGHCKHFKPEWNKFEEWAKINNIKCRSINGENYNELTTKYKIEGYPTVLKVNSNGDLIEEFYGDRTLDGLKSFCSN